MQDKRQVIQQFEECFGLAKLQKQRLHLVLSSRTSRAGVYVLNCSYLSLCVFVCVYVHMRVYMYVGMHVCVYVCGVCMFSIWLSDQFSVDKMSAFRSVRRSHVIGPRIPSIRLKSGYAHTMRTSATIHTSMDVCIFTCAHTNI